MAYQMVYTSVRSGLVAGRSGFCTAARHRELKESLVARLEDFSAQYDRGLGGADDAASLPVIYQYRIITIRESHYHVLMRLGDAGNDYSGRTNHIAHSLVLEPAEVSRLRITPAEAILGLLRQGFWKASYEESAKYYGPSDVVDLVALPDLAALPASHWARKTGSAANAAQLYGGARPCESGIVLSTSSQTEISDYLTLVAESLLIQSPDRSDPESLWSVSFTTSLQSAAERNQFLWCGLLSGSGLSEQEARSGRKIVNAAISLTPPVGALAQIAQGIRPQESHNIEVIEKPPIYSTIQIPAAAAGSTNKFGAGSQQGGEVLPQEIEDLGPLVSISLDNLNRKSRQPRRGKHLAVFVGVCAVALGLVWVGYWAYRKDVWKAEKAIEELIGQGNWTEVEKRFANNTISKDTKGKSQKLEEWQEASRVIYKLNKLRANPESHRDISASSKSGEEARIEVLKNWKENPASSNFELSEVIERAAEEAERSTKSWSEAMIALTNAWKSAKSPANQGPAATNPLDGAMKLFGETVEGGENSQAKGNYKKTFEYLLENFKEIEAGRQRLNVKYTEQAKLESAKNEVRALVIKADDLQIELEKEKANSGNNTQLNNVYSSASEAFSALNMKLNSLIAPGKDSLALVEQMTELPPAAEAGKMDSSEINEVEKSESTAEVPTTYLVEILDGVIRLNGIDELEKGFPDEGVCLIKTNLFAQESQGEVIKLKVNQKMIYGSRNKPFLSQIGGGDELSWKFEDEARKDELESGSRSLRIEGKGSMGKLIRILFYRNPSRESGAKTSTVPGVKALDTSYAPLVRVAQVMLVERKADGTICLNKDTQTILDHFKPKVDQEFKYQLRLISSGSSTLQSISPKFRDLALHPEDDMDKKITSLKADLENRKKSLATQQYFEENYTNLQNKLFPEWFSEGGIRYFDAKKIKGKSAKSTYLIEKISVKRPAGGILNVTNLMDDGGGINVVKFHAYLLSLFKGLDDLADGSLGLNEAAGLIERYIEGAEDLQTEFEGSKYARGWVELTKLSKEKRWSSGPVQMPTGPFGDEKEANEALEEYLAKKYFSDFFREWEKLFGEVEVKQLIAYLNSTSTLSSPQKLKDRESELAAAEQSLSYFKDDDLSNDGTYLLNLIIEDAKNSSTPISHTIPLIEGVAAH